MANLTGQGRFFWTFAPDDKVALRSEEGEAWSYAELDTMIETHPLASRERGLHVLQTDNTVLDVVTLLSGLRHGHALILTSDRERAGVLAQRFSAECVWSREEATRTGLASPALHPELALMLSTSGSTGAGKCVRLSHANLSSNAAAIAEYLGLRSEERAITSLPLHYSYGLSVLTSHLHAGASITLTDHSIVDPPFIELMKRDAIASLAGVPHSYDLMERSGFRDSAPASLTTLTQAGGKLDPAKAESFRAWIASRGGRMFVMYGQTEATARIAYVPADELATKPGFIGRPIPGGQIELIDEQGDVIDGDGMAGELVYRGPNVMLGYALEASDLGRGRDIDALRTGDIAMRKGGFFRIVGRQSRFTKMFGLRVDLDEVESQLRLEGIETAVAGDDNQLVIATVGASTCAVEKVITKLALPGKAVRHLDLREIPRLENGKPDYQALLRDDSLFRETMHPGSVQELYRRTFPQAKIGDDSCFTDLGGDSLTYVAFSLDLEDLMGELPDGWENLSVGALRERTREAKGRAKHGSRILPMDAALRALGIASVVGNHASNAPVGGGVAALILLVGYSLARFQRKQLVEGAWAPFLKRWATAIFLPYVVIIAAYAIFVKPVPTSLFTLTANYDPSLHGFVQPFWFISAYSQLILLVVGAVAVAMPVRLAIRQNPFASGFIVFIAGTGLVAAAATQGFAASGRGILEILPLAALGWCAAVADTRSRRIVVALAACALAGFEGVLRWNQGWSAQLLALHLAWWLLPPLLLLSRQSFSAPRWLWGAVMAVSAASFTIYLTHTLPIWLAARASHENPGLWAAAIALVFGVFVHRTANWIGMQAKGSSPVR